MRRMSQPTKIGKYEILSLAGEGSMGVVFKAHDPFSDAPVAIKLCPVTEGNSFKLARKLFFNEARTAGVLDHPNILSVLDAGEHDGQPYIVMEYVSGGETLRSHIASATLLPLAQVAEILYRSAKALDYAHRRGVVHRDIKPSNIMLSADGVPKIGDFGIAQHALSDETQLMGMLGSPRYMSPEQAQEDEISHHTDLYSLGVVGYELITGEPPFLARNITQLVQKIVTEPPRPLAELRPDLPPAMAAVIERAMAKRPEDRYGHGHEMANDIAAVYGGLETASNLKPERGLEIARGMTFFNDFSDSELEQILLTGAWTRHEAGTSLLNQDDNDEAFYLLAQGRASVTVDGTEVAELTEGECFGEMGLMRGGKRSARVTGNEACTVLRIDGRLIEHAPLECQLRFTRAFVEVLSRRLVQSNRRIHSCLSQR